VPSTKGSARRLYLLETLALSSRAAGTRFLTGPHAMSWSDDLNAMVRKMTDKSSPLNVASAAVRNE
jgi:hypothetical protein